MPKRFWAYLLGISVLLLSKLLIPLILHIILRVWHLPDQVVAYWLGKGPPFVTATVFILFGIDHILSPRDSLVIWAGRGSRYAQVAGGVALGLGIVVLYLTFTGRATAVYDARFLPPLPYP